MDEMSKKTCTYCTCSIESVLEYKTKGFRNFKRQYDRMFRNLNLLGEKMYNLEGSQRNEIILLFLSLHNRVENILQQNKGIGGFINIDSFNPIMHNAHTGGGVSDARNISNR